MIKNSFLISYILFINFNYVFSQPECLKCADYHNFIEKGLNYLNNSNYDAALPEFQAAQIAARICKCRSNEPDKYINKAFIGIQKQKTEAERLEKEIKKNLTLAQQQKVDIEMSIKALGHTSIELKKKSSELEQQKGKLQKTLADVETKQQETITQQAATQKLINAFYFYGDSLALAYKDMKFGFINKKGDVIINYQYDDAEQFDDKGLAKVGNIFFSFDPDTYEESIESEEFLLDTKGNEYKVAYKIEDLADDVLAFDARGIELDSFPREVLENLQLEVLILDWQKNIKNIPKEIGRLENLKKLYLNFTTITELPKEIGQLRNLTNLDLDATKITELPKEIEQLKNLRELHLGFANITKLPKEIGQLKNLRELYLDYAGITELPKEIGQIENLRKLDLSNTSITKLPKEIGQLKNLRKLDIFDTKITELPKEIGQLKNLRDLYLGINIHWISLNNTSGRKTLTITNIPKEITNLKNLRTLNLQYTQISPETIQQLKQQLPNCEIIY